MPSGEVAVRVLHLELRDYFAAQVIGNSLICEAAFSDWKVDGKTGRAAEYFSRRAYEIADAMLTERAKS